MNGLATALEIGIFRRAFRSASWSNGRPVTSGNRRGTVAGPLHVLADKGMQQGTFFRGSGKVAMHISKLQSTFGCLWGEPINKP